MNPKNALLIGGGTVLAAAVAVFIWSSGPKTPANAMDPAKTEASADQKRPRPTATGITGQDSGSGTLAGGEASGKLTPEQQEALAKERQGALAILDQAATTYDAAQLPVIDKYLYHQDPVIRKSAMEAMLVLGDHTAGKLLRDAAEAAASPEEKKALLAAADYAELPPADPKDQIKMLKNFANSERDKRRTDRVKGLSTTRREARANPAPTTPAPAAPAPVPTPGQ